MDKAGISGSIIEEAKVFAEKEIAPLAAEFDRAGVLPRYVIDKLAEKKFLAPNFPVEYGGLGLDPVSYGLFTEEIGKACCSTRSLITVHASLVGETLLRWGKEAQKERWLRAMAEGTKIGAFALSEPEVGSDAGGVKTAYRRGGGGFIVSGRKKWISFGEIADFFVVVASEAENKDQKTTNDDADSEGQEVPGSRTAPKKRKVSVFIVERERDGILARRIPGMLGCRAAHVSEMEFKDVAVPEENLLGKEGAGFPYVAGTALDHGRYSVAWGGVAVAQAALEAMVGYARQRSQFGKKIHEFQLVRGLIGDAVTKTHAARAMCLKAGEMRRDGHREALHETAMAKYFASEVALEVASDAVQAHGGSGCSQDYPVERFFREAKILQIIEGTSQIQQEMLANFALRKYHKKVPGTFLQG